MNLPSKSKLIFQMIVIITFISSLFVFSVLNPRSGFPGLVMVKALPSLPKTKADEAIVLNNFSLILDALENDSVMGSIIELGIAEAPELGFVLINEDHTFTYQPHPGFCGKTDRFTYYVANDAGSTKSTVRIEILCESGTNP